MKFALPKLKPADMVLGVLLLFYYFLVFGFIFEYRKLIISLAVFQILSPMGLLFFAYVKRQELQKAWGEMHRLMKENPSLRPFGSAFLFWGGVVLLIFGMFINFNYVSALGFVISMAGVILYMYGYYIFRMLLPGVLYLLFLMPIPQKFLGILIVGLQLKLSVVVGYIVNIFKMSPQVQGYSIIFPNQFVMYLSRYSSGVYLCFPVVMAVVLYCMLSRTRVLISGGLVIVAILLSVLEAILVNTLGCLLGYLLPPMLDVFLIALFVLFFVLDIFLIRLVIKKLNFKRNLREVAF